MFTRYSAAALLLVLLSACSKPVTDKTQVSNTQPALDSRGLISNFNLLAYQSLANTTQQLAKLESSLAQLMQLPNPGNLEQTQQAWIEAHNAWLKASLLTQINFSNSHPRDDEQLLQRIDSWPVMGGYIDYLPGYPYSGIVNDLTLPIEGGVIKQQQGFGVSLGFHALEFMLWGEDGKRSARDFIPQENTLPLELDDTSVPATDNIAVGQPVSGSQVAQEAENSAQQPMGMAELTVAPQNHMRRRQYVRLIGQMLSEDIQKLQTYWEPAQGYYTELLESQPADSSLRNILRAMQNVILKDISAQLAADPDNHHSAFNQQQHRSYQEILVGLGDFYQSPGVNNTLASALAEQQPELAEAYSKQLQQALSLGQKIAKQKRLQDKDKQAMLEALNLLQRLHSEIPTALKLSTL